MPRQYTRSEFYYVNLPFSHLCVRCSHEWRSRFEIPLLCPNCKLKDPTSETKRRKHGMTGTPTSRSWGGMVNRCTNPTNQAYARYGGRGINVCDRWRLFKNFLEDMGERPAGTSIERIDNNKGYEPGNCKWATRKEQSRNMRNNINITYGGVTKNITDWAEDRQIIRSTLYSRFVEQGWSAAETLEFEPRSQRGRSTK